MIKENNTVNYIRFRYKFNEKTALHTCPQNVKPENVTVISKENTTIFQTAIYTDNNHFVRYSWYRDEVIGSINGGWGKPGTSSKRPPESPLMYRAKKDCKSLGLFTYGREHGAKPIIKHLDGRLTLNLTKVIG
jgi:hypothetical protein